MKQTPPTTTTRAVLYVRVSTEEQAAEGHSIDAQLRALRDFCARKSWQVVGEYVDAGVSGKTLKRPKMQALLHDATATPRAFDVIVVHKLDRFSRSILDTIATLTRLKEIGIGLASATQPIDFTTPEGKAMLMMLAVFAEIYIDNLSKETAKGREERARKGFANGHVPFGYRAVKKNATNDAERGVEFDPENIEGYRLAIRLCADGKRVSEIMDELNARGYRSTSFRGVRPFSKDMLFHMLKNRFYLGQVQYKGEWMPGKHPAAIDRETWERAQMQMERRAFSKGGHHNRRARPYVLRGLVFCGECGNRLAGWVSNGNTRHYRCPARDRGETCSQTKAIRAANLESEIGALLARMQLPDDWTRQVLQMLGEGDPENARRDKQRANVEGQLERLRVVFQLGDISEAAYRAERDRLRNELAQLRPVKRFDLERAADVLRNFGALWQQATPAEQEDIAHSLIERLFVFNGKIVSVEPKTDIYPLLAIAAQETGIEVRWETDTLQPHLTRHPVLVIVPAHYYARPDTRQHRASISPLRDVVLGRNNGKSETSFGAIRPQERKNKKRAPRVTRSQRKRDPRANTGRKKNE